LAAISKIKQTDRNARQQAQNDEFEEEE